MKDPLIFIVETSVQRRFDIQTALQRVPQASVSTFDTFSVMKKAVRARQPNLVIGPWAQGGETLLSVRTGFAGSAATGVVPSLLMLTERVSPARISLARQAGNAELIPLDPLDHDALFNRAVLLLYGTEGLYSTLPCRDMTPLEAMLENLPALKKRLAA